MQPVVIRTQSDVFRKARSVNQTSNGYVSKLPTITEPSGDAGTATGSAVIDLANLLGGQIPNAMLIAPYAVGSNNNTFSLRVIGWRFIPGSGQVQTGLWIPVLLCEIACTLSNVPVGVAGMVLVATELFADTLVLTTGNSGVSAEILSNAGDVIAHAVVDLKGFQKVELSFTTGGSATSCNAILSFY